MSERGLWIPSKMAPIMPGPSSTDRGFPVRSTGSPTETPAKDVLRKSSSRATEKPGRSHQVHKSILSNPFSDFKVILFLYYTSQFEKHVGFTLNSEFDQTANFTIL